MQNETIPTNDIKPCDCCKRLHRKLKNTDGFWMGETCTGNYRTYKNGARDINSIVWRGWESQYRKVARMFGETK